MCIRDSRSVWETWMKFDFSFWLEFKQWFRKMLIKRLFRFNFLGSRNWIMLPASIFRRRKKKEITGLLLLEIPSSVIIHHCIWDLLSENSFVNLSRCLFPKNFRRIVTSAQDFRKISPLENPRQFFENLKNLKNSNVLFY